MADQQGYAVGWLALAFINAGLAQSKSRTGRFWWLGSLFIGPVATALIVLLDRPATPRQPDGQA